MASMPPPDFAKALTGGTLTYKTVLIGKIKAVQGEKAFQFSPGMLCRDWIKVPFGVIDVIEWLGRTPGPDGELYETAKVTLKQPQGNADLQALQELLLSYTRHATSATFPEIKCSRSGTRTISPSDAITGVCDIFVDGHLYAESTNCYESVCSSVADDLQLRMPGHVVTYTWAAYA